MASFINMEDKSPTMKILVAEDEKDMLKIIGLYLKKEGYQVTLVSNGQEAMEHLYETSFDLVILDWMMPKMDGIAVIKEIRKLNISCKIILLTAKSQIEHEVMGLSIGADDYIKKPFEPQILLLRIKKLLKLEKVMTCGPIWLNQESYMVKVHDKEVVLSKKEFELLRFFMMNQGMVLSRERLLNQVWGMDYDGNERTVDTHIKRLRAKISDSLLTTHVGIGYCLEKQ